MDLLHAAASNASEVLIQLFLTTELRGDEWAPAWTVSPPGFLAVTGAALLELGDGGEPELVLLASGRAGLGSWPTELQFYDAILSPDGPTLIDATPITTRRPLLANAGDVDGDGDDELFLGFERLSPPGGVEVRPDLAASWRPYRIAEADPATGNVWTEVGVQPDPRTPNGQAVGGEDFEGWAIGAAGDFDGNGVMDLAVAVNEDAGGPYDIQIWLYGPEVPPPVIPEETGDTGLPEIGPEFEGYSVVRPEEEIPVVRFRSPAARGCAGSAAIGLLGLTGLVSRRRLLPPLPRVP
jgi:hypothetical protein